MKASRWLVLAAAPGLLAIALSLPQAAEAGTSPRADGPPSELVHFADLNPDSSAGAQILYERIVRAAHTVCEPYAAVGHLMPSGAWYRCVDQAIAGAVRRVDRPLLTAYYARRQGQVVASRLVSQARE